MARVPSVDTAAELALRRALWARGMRYRLHGRLPGTPDIVFRSARLAVFVDGCFWHGCELHYTSPVRNSDFWSAKLIRNRQRDAAVDEALRGLGWRVLRVWEHEVLREPQLAVDRVERRLTGTTSVRGRGRSRAIEPERTASGS